MQDKTLTLEVTHNENGSYSYQCLIAQMRQLPDPSSPGFPAAADQAVSLSTVALDQAVIVCQVRSGNSAAEGGDIGLRLQELGFVAGERLRVIAHGHPGREPVAVRIGNTTFALRRFEADHVLVVAARE